jgi:hypothetical protein
LDASDNQWKDPVEQLLLHTCGDLEQLLQIKANYVFDEDNDDQLRLQLLLSLDKEVFLLYLSSDAVRVATEVSVLRLINLWMVKNSPARRSRPFQFHNIPNKQKTEQHAALAEELLAGAFGYTAVPKPFTLSRIVRLR